MIDTSGIDIIAIIEQYGGYRYQKQGTNYRHGDEYSGPCPFCKSGDNRFLIWPQSEVPHYWCRRCKAGGDVITFLQRCCTMTFRDACVLLNIEGKDNGIPYKAFTTHTPIKQPSKQWQETGRSFTERAERFLWKSEEAREAREYLKTRRITDKTLKDAHIGYCPSWYEVPLDQWGIDPMTISAAKRERGTVVIPPGIVIPWFGDGALWKIAVKRPNATPSYGQVLGSVEGLYNMDALRIDLPAMMVEGEMDCLSAIQEAGDIVACVATGGVDKARKSRWETLLCLAPYVLQSFDNDEAGQEGAHYWDSVLEESLRWPSPIGKDVNSFLQTDETPYTVREWVQFGMNTYTHWISYKQELKESRVETQETAVHDPLYNGALESNMRYSCLSDSCTRYGYRVLTPDGPGTIHVGEYPHEWLRMYAERNGVTVTLDARIAGNKSAELTGAALPFPHGVTAHYPVDALTFIRKAG